MENRFYDVIVEEMSGFFKENNFTEKNGIFSNGQKAIKIEYDEARKVYNLFMANVAEGEVGEFSNISTFLFDDSHTKNDAVSVGIDFLDSAKKAMGIRTGFKGSSAVDLPTAQGEIATVSALTAKLLANYPELKEVYKSEVEEKGKYLYLDFASHYFIPEIRKTLDQNNKKAVKKLIDMFCEIFVEGDRSATTLVVVMLAAAIGKNADRFKAATEKMENCQPLITSINNEIMTLVKNKKFAKAVGFDENA